MHAVLAQTSSTYLYLSAQVIIQIEYAREDCLLKLAKVVDFPCVGAAHVVACLMTAQDMPLRRSCLFLTDQTSHIRCSSCNMEA